MRPPRQAPGHRPLKLRPLNLSPSLPAEWLGKTGFFAAMFQLVDVWAGWLRVDYVHQTDSPHTHTHTPPQAMLRTRSPTKSSSRLTATPPRLRCPPVPRPSAPGAQVKFLDDLHAAIVEPFTASSQPHTHTHTHTHTRTHTHTHTHTTMRSCPFLLAFGGLHSHLMNAGRPRPS